MFDRVYDLIGRAKGFAMDPEKFLIGADMICQECWSAGPEKDAFYRPLKECMVCGGTLFWKRKKGLLASMVIQSTRAQLEKLARGMEIPKNGHRRLEKDEFKLFLIEKLRIADLKEIARILEFRIYIPEKDT